MKDYSQMLFIKKILFLLVLSAILFGCSLIYQLAMHRCVWWECAPPRTFTVYDLELPEDIYPAGADIKPLSRDSIFGPIEKVASTSHAPGGAVTYLVYRFATEKQAKEWFQKDINAIASLLETTPIRPDEFDQIEKFALYTADEYQIACGFTLNGARCATWMRYEEFFLMLFAPSGMPAEKYLMALQFIDQRMKNLLSEP